jgi:hypothetical protein
VLRRFLARGAKGVFVFTTKIQHIKQKESWRVERRKKVVPPPLLLEPF